MTILRKVNKFNSLLRLQMHFEEQHWWCWGHNTFIWWVKIILNNISFIFKKRRRTKTEYAANFRSKHCFKFLDPFC
jgi:hypothetical protein